VRELPPGAPRLVVFLAAGCGPCERLAPALREVDGVAVTAVVAGEMGLGPIARPDLEHLFDRWAIPGTPFAVALDATGTVVRSEVATPEVLTELAQAARGTAPRSSRRLLLQTGAAVAAGSVLLRAESAWALARRATARLARYTPDVEWDTDRRNNFTGTCLEFADRLEETGVYVEGKAMSRPDHNAGGYTWAAGYQPDDPVSSVPIAVCRRDERWQYEWKGFCPCDDRQYTDATLCHEECPDGLRCLGHCQTTFERHCVEARVDICLPQPRIVIYVLRWTPRGPGATVGCRAMADRINRGTGLHELDHATATRAVIADVGAGYENRRFRVCGLTREAAKAELDRQIGELMRQAQQEARTAVELESVAVHRARRRTRLECPNCPVPKKRKRRRR
jgi:hypothetical protein